MNRAASRPDRGRALLLGLTLLVGLLAVAGAVWVTVDHRSRGEALREVRGPDGEPLAPHGLVSLQMPTSANHARRIVAGWDRAVLPSGLPATTLARRLVHDDRRLMALYLTGLVVLIAWGGWASRVPRPWFVAWLLLPFLAVAADWGENLTLQRLLDVTPIATGEVDRVRLLSQLKFVAMLLASIGAVTLTGGGIRLCLGRAAPRLPQPRSFKELMDDETASVLAARPGSAASDPDQRLRVAAAEEPRVRFRSSDVIGLALSGGGIRSATFNLGLLQELAARRVLPLVDYLSTVSGGGYVGGFLSAWLGTSRSGAAMFPGVQDGDDQPPEPGEVRHLREFSEFLVPRRGFFEQEMWRAVVALLAGLLPAVAMALSMIGLGLVLWLALTLAYAARSELVVVIVLVAVTLVVLALLETWRPSFLRSPAATAVPPGPAGPATPAPPIIPAVLVYPLTSGLAILVVVALQALVPSVNTWLFESPVPLLDAFIERTAEGETRHWSYADLSGDEAYDRWWRLVGARQAHVRVAAEAATMMAPSTGGLLRTLFFSPRLFDFALVWLAAGVVLLVLRLLHPLSTRSWSLDGLSAFDRVVMRLLALGVVWALLAGMWHLCANLGFAWELLVPTLLSGAGFAATRRWMTEVIRPPAGATSVWARVQEYTPQVLAYLTLILTVGAVGSALIDWNQDDWLWWYRSTALMAGVLTLGMFLDPGLVGLHAFYRERLGRAYLGARLSREAAANRSADSQAEDDLPLSALPARPLHLICCAANDLKGDPVATLTRGARSATLSRFGFTIGADHQAAGAVTLGAAVTASAAAFNSAMGAHSVRFGPVVGFLLTALNLRLGLWVRHPRARAAATRRWPGLLLYREFFGLTSTSGYRPDAEGLTAPTVLQRDVHLSDGGHFENLGLYELVRRRCRYIIVSDCGADPDVAFDDFGNALRRVREDFGVEIQVDVAPLRPDDKGYSAQHAVVGTIHYGDIDHGVLVYIKPTLTGDEPPDVLQYKTRNAAFPHEGTSDQFYDEAQWESYRRLGHHAAERAFGFMREVGEPPNLTADWLFTQARLAWYPTPVGLQAQVLAMTDRFGQLEQELRGERDGRLLREVFPEVDYLQGTPAATSSPAVVTAADLGFMLRITQGMEDVWTACRLDSHWGHPINTGWVNLFARWTTAPTFRQWWPVLAPLYNPGFQRFLKHRLGVGVDDGSVDRPRFQLREVEPPLDGLAAHWWLHRTPGTPRWSSAPQAFTFYAFEMQNGHDARTLQMGLTAVTSRGRIAGWSSRDFFVPPSLWGASYGGRMLGELLTTLARGHDRCYVCVKKPVRPADHRVAREDERSFVAQYRSFHFQQLAPEDIEGAIREELASLGLGDTPEDTILVLDFARWRTLNPLATSR